MRPFKMLFNQLYGGKISVIMDKGKIYKQQPISREMKLKKKSLRNPKGLEYYVA